MWNSTYYYTVRLKKYRSLVLILNSTMKIKKIINIFSLILSMIFLNAFASNAHADFTIIVPFSPGGAYDKQARLFANYVTETTNEKVIVKNITGAGSVIGTRELLNSDGNNIMITSGSFFKNIVDNVFKKEDFRLVNILGISPFTLLTSKNLSCEDLKDKSRNFFIGTAGPGSATDTASLLLQTKYRNITLVPYKGVSQVLIDLHPGRLDFAFVAGAPRTEFKAVVSTSTTNFYKGVNNWKTCLDIDINYWVENLVVTKSSASDDFVKRINLLVNEFLSNKEVQERMINEDGIMPTPLKYSELDKNYNLSITNWKKIKNILTE